MKLIKVVIINLVSFSVIFCADINTLQEIFRKINSAQEGNQRKIASGTNNGAVKGFFGNITGVKGQKLGGLNPKYVENYPFMKDIQAREAASIPPVYMFSRRFKDNFPAYAAEFGKRSADNIPSYFNGAFGKRSADNIPSYFAGAFGKRSAGSIPLNMLGKRSADGIPAAYYLGKRSAGSFPSHYMLGKRSSESIPLGMIDRNVGDNPMFGINYRRSSENPAWGIMYRRSEVNPAFGIMYKRSAENPMFGVMKRGISENYPFMKDTRSGKTENHPAFAALQGGSADLPYQWLSKSSLPTKKG